MHVRRQHLEAHIKINNQKGGGMLKRNVRWGGLAFKQGVRLAALIVAVIFNSSCEAGMATKENAVIFSRVQGRIFFNGEPVRNAKVIRRYTYDVPDAIEDACNTDENGNFELPLIERKNEKVKLMTQFVVHQELYVVFGGKEYNIWLHGKMNRGENSEYGGHFKIMSCEIAQDLKRIEVGGNVVLTNCIWETN
jgi:hypothetical protein